MQKYFKNGINVPFIANRIGTFRNKNGIFIENFIIFVRKKNCMPQVNPLITTPEEQFVVGESDFAFFGNYACRVEGGAILFCRSGSADATVNQYQGQVRRNTMVLLLPGSISFPRRPSGWTLRFSTPCASVRSPIRPSGSSRGLRSGSRWRPTPTATAATCSAIRSSRTVCRICCWRVTTRCSVSQPGSTACRRRPRGSRSCSTVSSLSCTSIAPRSAKCRFTPTNSAFRPVTCRPSCAAWRTVRPRSSSTVR